MFLATLNGVVVGKKTSMYEREFNELECLNSLVSRVHSTAVSHTPCLNFQ